jgi:hypothetical protein
MVIHSRSLRRPLYAFRLFRDDWKNKRTASNYCFHHDERQPEIRRDQVEWKKPEDEVAW